jgi:fibronectin-binding autotransporter adhesin
LTVDNPTITVFGEVRSFPTNTPLGFIPSFILSGIITDGANSYGLTKAGPGTLSLDRVNEYNGTTTIAEGNLRLTAAVGSSNTAASTMGDGNSPVTLSGGNIEYTGAPINGARVMTINNPVTMTSSSGVGHRTGSGAGGLTLTSPTVDIVFNNFVATGGTLTLYNDGSSNEPNLANYNVNPLEFRVGFAGSGFDFTQPIVTVNHTDTDVPNRTTSLMSSNTTGSHTFSGVISGNGGYVRNGAGGTSVLTGNNTYTGNTKVLAGTLSNTNPFLADTADVLLITGGILDLNFVGTDTIDQLFIDTFSQPTGTWGGIGSGAMNESPLITGTGLLMVSNPGAGLGASVVPEPSTASLVLFVMGGLAAGRPRRPDGRR